MTTKAEYLAALSAALERPVTADTDIPGLGDQTWAILSLWGAEARTREMLGEGVTESFREGREFAASGPWDD